MPRVCWWCVVVVVVVVVCGRRDDRMARDVGCCMPATRADVDDLVGRVAGAQHRAGSLGAIVAVWVVVEDLSEMDSV